MYISEKEFKMYTRDYLYSLYNTEKKRREDAYISTAVDEIKDIILDLATKGKTQYMWYSREALSQRQQHEILKTLQLLFPDSKITKRLNGLFVDWWI